MAPSPNSITATRSSARSGPLARVIEPAITKATMSPDRKSVRLTVDGLQEGHIHDLTASGIRAADGRALLHAQAYYTLNYVPKP